MGVNTSIVVTDCVTIIVGTFGLLANLIVLYKVSSREDPQ